MKRADKFPQQQSRADAGPSRTRLGAAPCVAAGPERESEAARLEQAHRICPGCGAAMLDRGCKLRCPRCGFFLDCSDG